MGTVTITLSEKIKSELKRFSWVNWSEIVRLETLKKLKEEKEIERFHKIVSKSKLTEEQAEEFANEVKEGMARRHGLT